MEITRLFDLLPHYEQSFKPKDDVLAGKENNEWKKYSIQEFREIVDNLSYAFLQLGVKKNDNIATVTNNRPEWNFIDMSVMQIGAVHVPIYPTISMEDYQHILNHAEIKYLFLSGMTMYKKLEPIIGKMEHLKGVYIFNDEDGMPKWTELLELGKQNQNKELLEEIKASIVTDDPATLIYTSGTTGVQKGVLLSHRGIIVNVMGVSPTPDFGDGTRALSILPLSHVYERVLNYLYLYLGIAIYYAESIAKFQATCVEIQPYMMCCVPRVLEKLYDGIMAKGRKLKGIKKGLFFWAVRIAEKYELNGANGAWYQFKWSIANKLVLSKWKEAIGGNFRIVVSGGSALNPRLGRIFHAAQIPIYEGYGLTETSPVIAVSQPPPKGLKIGTVGPPLPGVEVRIAEDGEILSRGPNIMIGYYRQPELNKTVIDEEGWFHTGDIGKIDEDGHVVITGRKKENFKTSGGKWIAPQPIENKLTESSFIETAVVLGENQKMAGALIIPNFEHLKSWCKIKGIDYTTDKEMVNNKIIIERIRKEVEKVNFILGGTEKIGPILLIADTWSVDSGELSATLKVKRNVVFKKYADEIEKMFN
ncbi:long-chain fatty acid--CoA ligase [Odoribacter sp. OttesenSCG-928-L07]|nr:long-chain fatty acid--CoA ligase [Odoribacter sp. OttesenSCG-928-L07]MDL2239182.1 long-chain fatty acid--CoA ligase [Bacteroidales bacterium OttesenSCG-928-L14]MDL2240526.1 long-chain fatty acid--CoA ligase [Bacteroidales bacterium OttesenSCG-928-K22]